MPYMAIIMITRDNMHLIHTLTIVDDNAKKCFIDSTGKDMGVHKPCYINTEQNPYEMYRRATQHPLPIVNAV